MTELERKARAMLRRFPLIDGHNDLPWALRERASGDVSQVRLVPGDPAAVNLAAPVEGTHAGWPRCSARRAATRSQGRSACCGCCTRSASGI